ncbi:barstar family protein [Plantactinospora solaniradicis]|uniref:Barstar family protein n=1 Tax=Plantactinospora solaniradicis TaxID=1723736 RepID=A0ABW1KE96_9ACTN
MTGRPVGISDRIWRWDRDVPLRWLLVDEDTGGRNGPDVVLGACAHLDGLFVDPVPAREPERYTLLGCEPAGRLRAALDRIGTDAARLGNVVLDPVHGPGRPDPGCQRYGTGCSCSEELLDLVVLDSQPSTLGPGLVDIDLWGHIQVIDGDRPPAARPPDADGFRLSGSHDDEPLGGCRQTGGVFRERPVPAVPPVTLVGCRPEPPLRTALEPLPDGPVTRRAAARRRVRAALYAVDGNGVAVSIPFDGLAGTVTGSRPSELDGALVDITLDGGFSKPLPSGAEEIWRRWYDGRPRVPNLWAGYDREVRHQWSGAALAHHRDGRPDRRAGRTYHLDGRYVTDVEGFYCAVGEAVNGPGGYFGWNLDALDDCLRGGWGAATPFRLVWHDADVARQYLVPGYDRWRLHPAVTLDYLLGMFREHGVSVELR